MPTFAYSHHLHLLAFAGSEPSFPIMEATLSNLLGITDRAQSICTEKFNRWIFFVEKEG